MLEKLNAASYSEQIQILTLSLKFSVMNILMSLNTSLKSREIKNVGGILGKPAPKRMKNCHH